MLLFFDQCGLQNNRNSVRSQICSIRVVSPGTQRLCFHFPPDACYQQRKSDTGCSYELGVNPYWTKDNETAQRIKQLALNARSETIFERPMFRQSILSKRCLVVVDGFFEWRHLNNQSYPYYIMLTNHQPFALAGFACARR